MELASRCIESHLQGPMVELTLLFTARPIVELTDRLITEIHLQGPMVELTLLFTAGPIVELADRLITKFYLS